MAHWRDEQAKKELLKKVQDTRGGVSLRHVSRDEGRVLAALEREGKLGSYMGDSGARRYHKK
jgi:hypothetical protein